MLAANFGSLSCIEKSFEIQMTGECLDKNAELFLDKFSNLLSENILLEPLDFTYNVKERCNFLTKGVKGRAAIFFPASQNQVDDESKIALVLTMQVTDLIQP